MPTDFWPDRVKVLTKRLGIDCPIIQAPMAGGPSTPELVAAVSNSGALGSLGVGYLPPEQIESEIHKVKELTNKPFSINLFVPDRDVASQPSDKVLNRLREFSEELGIDAPRIPGPSKYNFEDQLAVILENNVPIFSFTFGIPDKVLIKDLFERGVLVIGTATCVEEGVLLEQAGCSAIIAQGSEAGGHRGTFGSTEGTPMIGGLALVPQLADKVKIPVIASGGIMDGRGIAASIALGASAVQMGTAFLSCEEAGVPRPWLDRLLSSKDVSTVLTKAFSGKYARGIKNRFIDGMLSFEEGVASYPIQNSLTRLIRNTAKEKENSDFMSLWAGQGSAMSRKYKARELINLLVSETYDVLKSMTSNL
ncbi:MAG: nitronate monooxygenase [Thermodesulfobacteriota bacterium]|nr:MAG: nitronate monooxygenase [Thermodesulfobacteriota bacterium]